MLEAVKNGVSICLGHEIEKGKQSDGNDPLTPSRIESVKYGICSSTAEISETLRSF
jgi:hypothetical protein